jgi:serine/threonine protein kinase
MIDLVPEPVKSVVGSGIDRIHNSILSCGWYILHSRTFFRYLEQEHGITGVRPFRFSTWRHGCRYFIGNHRGIQELVFIKTGGYLHLVGREVEALARIYHADPGDARYFPMVVTYNSRDPYSFIATEYLHMVSISDHAESCKKAGVSPRRWFFDDMVAIVQVLHRAGVIHRDVRPGNLFIRTDQEHPCLVLIDFALAVTENGSLPEIEVHTRYEKKVLLGLGRKYTIRPFVWDDAYAFSRIAQEMDDRWDQHYPDQWRRLNGMIGRLVYRIDDPFSR